MCVSYVCVSCVCVCCVCVCVSCVCPVCVCPVCVCVLCVCVSCVCALQEPCIEEHCHDSWFPGTNLLTNLHHVINFVRVRVPETAPEVKREPPPSTSAEASTFGQVRSALRPGTQGGLES